MNKYGRQLRVVVMKWYVLSHWLSVIRKCTCIFNVNMNNIWLLCRSLTSSAYMCRRPLLFSWHVINEVVSSQSIQMNFIMYNINIFPTHVSCGYFRLTMIWLFTILKLNSNIFIFSSGYKEASILSTITVTLHNI